MHTKAFTTFTYNFTVSICEKVNKYKKIHAMQITSYSNTEVCHQGPWRQSGRERASEWTQQETRLKLPVHLAKANTVWYDNNKAGDIIAVNPTFIKVIV